MAEESSESRPSSLTWMIPLGIAAVLLGLYLLLPGFRSFVGEAWGVLASRDQSRIEAWIRGFGVWSLAVIGGILVVQPFLFVVPSTLMMLVAVLAYGPLWGGLLAWSGSMLAAVLAYGVGRALGPVTVDRLLGHSTEQTVEGYVKRYGVAAIIIARVSPVFSTDAISLVAGLVKMPFIRYVLATGAGFLPLALLIAFLGADFARLESGLLWIAAGSFIALALYVGYDRFSSAG